MADQFTDNSSDQISAAASSTINDFTALTIVTWVQFNATPASGSSRRIMRKTGNAASTGKGVSLTNAAGTLEIDFVTGRATTNAQAVATGTALTGAVFTTGVWYMLAATFDTTDGPRLFGGKLGTQLIEATSYVTRTTGSGGVNADSAAAMNVGLDSTNSFGGNMATFTYLGSRLTLLQLQAMQYRTREAVRYTVSTGLHWEMIYPPAGIAPDYSLNGNAGTKTGIAGDDHVPLGPRFQ
jgi:hypothetical protein